MKSIAARYSGREHVNVSSRSRRVPFQGLWIPCGPQFGLQDPRSRKDPANDTGQAAGDRPKSPDTRGLDRARCGLNLQVTVLKILVSYPDRFAGWRTSTACGDPRHQRPEWAERTKRLAARVPGLDIFSDGLVERQNGA
jgi:hypothetical protein